MRRVMVAAGDVMKKILAQYEEYAYDNDKASHAKA